MSNATAYVNTNNGSVYVYEDFDMTLAFTPIRVTGCNTGPAGCPIFRENDGHLMYPGEYRHVMKGVIPVLGDAGYIVTSDWSDAPIANALLRTSIIKQATLNSEFIPCPRGCGYVGRADYDRGWKIHFDCECTVDPEE
jgi:hypothetical protein